MIAAQICTAIAVIAVFAVSGVTILVGMGMYQRHERTLKRMEQLHELDREERERFSETLAVSRNIEKYGPVSKNGTIPPRPPIKIMYPDGSRNYGFRYWYERAREHNWVPWI